jgi:hypothetical protein
LLDILEAHFIQKKNISRLYFKVEVNQEIDHQIDQSLINKNNFQN